MSNPTDSASQPNSQPASAAAVPAHVPGPGIDLVHKSLSQNLRSLVDPADPQDLSLRRVLNAIEEKSFGLLLLILSLPSALPVPAAGYSTPFGIVLAILGIQMILGRTKPVVPKKFLDLTIKYKMAKRMIDAACKVLGWLERFIKPRFTWVGSRTGQRALGIVVVVMSVLMILPIPTTNTFPAIVIFALGVGLIEDDGLICGFGFLIGVFSIILYAVIIFLILYYGIEIVDHLKDYVKSLLSGGETAPPVPTIPAE